MSDIYVPPPDDLFRDLTPEIPPEVKPTASPNINPPYISTELVITGSTRSLPSRFESASQQPSQSQSQETTPNTTRKWRARVVKTVILAALSVVVVNDQGEDNFKYVGGQLLEKVSGVFAGNKGSQEKPKSDANTTDVEEVSTISIVPSLSPSAAADAEAEPEPTPTEPPEVAQEPEEVCYTVTDQSGKKIEGNYFHKSGNQTYPWENSPEGIRFAANHEYDSIDLDLRLTKDKVEVNTHDAQPMMQGGFYDPLGKIPKGTRINEMTFEQVSRLKNRDGQSRIYAFDKMVEVVAKNNLNISLDLKQPSLTKSLDDIVSTLNKNNVKAYVKADATIKALSKTLTEARKYGLSSRGTKGSQAWKPARSNC